MRTKHYGCDISHCTSVSKRANREVNHSKKSRTLLRKTSKKIPQIPKNPAKSQIILKKLKNLSISNTFFFQSDLPLGVNNGIFIW